MRIEPRTGAGLLVLFTPNGLGRGFTPYTSISLNWPGPNNCTLIMYWHALLCLSSWHGGQPRNPPKGKKVVVEFYQTIVYIYVAALHPAGGEVDE